MPRIALLVITDGRPYLPYTLQSAEQFLLPYIDGPTYLVSDVGHRLGLSGAIRAGWDMVQTDDQGQNEYVFHLEDDFVFTEPVPVDEMVALLDRLDAWQVALKRGPANPHEAAVGGFMEANPHNYAQRDGWVESGFGFTFNPCLYRVDRYGDNPRSYRYDGWQGEAGLSEQMRDEHPDRPFSIYGNIEDAPRCEHIGHQRATGWKL